MKLTRLIPEEEIESIVSRLASDINQHYAGRDLTVIVVLNGAFMFAADLVKKLTMPVTIEFVKASSYGEGTSSTGKVKVIMDNYISEKVTGKYVLIVDDIFDTGLTLKSVSGTLSEMRPISLGVCVPFVKQTDELLSYDWPRFWGISVHYVFVIGDGLDYKRTMSNLS